MTIQRIYRTFIYILDMFFTRVKIPNNIRQLRRLGKVFMLISHMETLNVI